MEPKKITMQLTYHEAVIARDLIWDVIKKLDWSQDEQTIKMLQYIGVCLVKPWRS